MCPFQGLKISFHHTFDIFKHLCLRSSNGSASRQGRNLCHIELTLPCDVDIIAHLPLRRDHLHVGTRAATQKERSSDAPTPRAGFRCGAAAVPLGSGILTCPTPAVLRQSLQHGLIGRAANRLLSLASPLLIPLFYLATGPFPPAPRSSRKP